MPESDLTLTNYPDRQAAAMSCLGRLIPNARNDGELCSAILANAGMARKVLVDEHTKLDQWLTEVLRQVEELLNEVGKLLLTVTAARPIDSSEAFVPRQLLWIKVGSESDLVPVRGIYDAAILLIVNKAIPPYARKEPKPTATCSVGFTATGFDGPLDHVRAFWGTIERKEVVELDDTEIQQLEDTVKLMTANGKPTTP